MIWYQLKHVRPAGFFDSDICQKTCSCLKQLVNKCTQFMSIYYKYIYIYKYTYCIYFRIPTNHLVLETLSWTTSSNVTPQAMFTPVTNTDVLSASEPETWWREGFLLKGKQAAEIMVVTEGTSIGTHVITLRDRLWGPLREMKPATVASNFFFWKMIRNVLEIFEGLYTPWKLMVGRWFCPFWVSAHFPRRDASAFLGGYQLSSRRFRKFTSKKHGRS